MTDEENICGNFKKFVSLKLGTVYYNSDLDKKFVRYK